MIEPGKKPITEQKQSEAAGLVADPSSPASPTPPDPFDIEALRISPEYVASVAVKKILTTIPVRKPNKQEWVRCHPDPDFRLSAWAVDLTEDREFYILTPRIYQTLSGFAVPVTLWTTITTTRALTLWPIVNPGPDGRDNSAYKSARDAAERATKLWTRLAWNNSLKAYDIFEPGDELADPVWPDALDGGMQALIKIAFRDRLINELDHPGRQTTVGSCLKCSTSSGRSCFSTPSFTSSLGRAPTLFAWSPGC
jgi:hypothetical protein